MYGYEAATGLGGLAAQAQPNAYMGRSMMIRDPGAMLAGDPTSEGGHQLLPYQMATPGGGGPMVSWGGGAVTQPASRQLGSWREIFDWHNSPAPWVLVLLLLAYGYVHISYRRGRVSVAGGRV